jgi:predicted dehydrogenase
MAKKKITRVGILGAGYMGGVHARNIAALPGAAVVAVCDLADPAQALAAKCKAAKTYTDYAAMLRDAALDAVVIALPPFAHSGQVEAAAVKGLAVFMEKPIALDLKRGASMLAAVRKAGVIAQVGYHMRFGTAVQRLKKMIESGAAGRPTLYDARYECNSLHKAWWRNQKQCGGQVFEQAIHLYDMSLHLLGAPVVVSGHIANLCHTQYADYTVEDTGAALIKFRSGALATIASSNCAIPGQWNGLFTVVCGKVSATFRDANNATFTITSGKAPKTIEVAGKVDCYREEMRAFLAAVQGKGPRLAQIDEGYIGLQMVSAVLASSKKNGQAIPIK